MMSNYPFGFSQGVSIRDLPILQTHPGKVWWVNNSTVLAEHAIAGSNGNDGSYLSPFSTIDYANGRCLAGRGDYIMVMPNHAESITAAAGIAMDVANVHIVGLGAGEDRPILTFTTAAAASIAVTAANCSLKNLVLKCNIASQNHMIDLAATDFLVDSCEFREGSTTGLSFITADTADADSDRLKIYNSLFYMPTAGNGDNAVQLAKDFKQVEIKGNRIHGDFDVSAIDIPAGGNAQIDLLIQDNIITNLLSAAYAIQVNGTGSTGKIIRNYVQTNALATAIDAGGCEVYDTWFHDGTDQVAAMPAVAPMDSTTNFIGVDDSDNLADTSNVAANENGSILERLEQIQEAVNNGTGTSIAANKSIVDLLGTTGTALVDDALSVVGILGVNDADNAFVSSSVAANEDGSILERLEQIQEAVNAGTGTSIAANKSLADAIGFDGSAVVAATAGMLRTAAGTTFVVKKTLTSSAVVQAGVDVTAVSTVGDIQILEVHAMTGGVGLAAGTLFTLETNNANGIAVFFTEAVADLGTAKTETVALADAGSFAPILESGKKVIAKCTGADCTGAGTVDVYLICRRLADNATLAAAA